MSILIDGTSGITPLAFSSNLQFTSTGQRITGDFSNATIANRVMFQSSTTNGLSLASVLPNGTSQQSGWFAYNNSDPTNASHINFQALSTEGRITSGIHGTGTYLPMTFYTGGSERMRIDTSGNVGIGTSSPGYALDVSTQARIGNGTGQAILRLNGGSSGSNLGAAIFFQNAGATNNGIGNYSTIMGGAFNTDLLHYVGSANNQIFFTSGTERMRIDTSGNVSIGMANASYGRLSIFNGQADGAQTVANSGLLFGQSAGWAQAGIWPIGGAGFAGSLVFGTVPSGSTYTVTERMRITSGGEVYIAGTTDQGAYNLQCNGTGVWGAGAYVNGSDAALKENVTTLDNSLGLVNAMRPVTFTYKEDYSKDRSVQPGFIAQELQEVLSGKNYLDGIVQAGPEYLNVAYQNLIPLLVKSIQELTARVEELENK